MSARGLSRHFLAANGDYTARVRRTKARVDAARGMLEASERALKAVAFDCGFGTADRMRAIFTQRLGVTPHQYRTSFRPGRNTERE